MARAEKVAAVAELTERFQTSAGAVLTEYRGLTVAQLAELRGSLGEHTTFAVVKNTLTKLAATEAGVRASSSAISSTSRTSLTGWMSSAERTFKRSSGRLGRSAASPRMGVTSYPSAGLRKGQARRCVCANADDPRAGGAVDGNSTHFGTIPALLYGGASGAMVR